MARRGTVPDRGDIVWLKAWTGRLDARNAKAGHRTRWLQTFWPGSRHCFADPGRSKSWLIARKRAPVISRLLFTQSLNHSITAHRSLFTVHHSPFTIPDSPSSRPTLLHHLPDLPCADYAPALNFPALPPYLREAFYLRDVGVHAGYRVAHFGEERRGDEPDIADAYNGEPQIHQS